MICIYWPVRTKCAPPGRRDTLTPILQAPDCKDLLQWLAAQPLARHLQKPAGAGFITGACRGIAQLELASHYGLRRRGAGPLRSSNLPNFLQQMYGNTPDRWDDTLVGMQRWRVIVNALTRLRFCNALGHMDFSSSEAASAAPAGLMPWFDFPHRQTANTCIAFGHWSTLGLRNQKT